MTKGHSQDFSANIELGEKKRSTSKPPRPPPKHSLLVHPQPTYHHPIKSSRGYNLICGTCALALPLIFFVFFMTADSYIGVGDEGVTASETKMLTVDEHVKIHPDSPGEDGDAAGDSDANPDLMYDGNALDSDNRTSHKDEADGGHVGEDADDSENLEAQARVSEEADPTPDGGPEGELKEGAIEGGSHHEHNGKHATAISQAEAVETGEVEAGAGDGEALEVAGEELGSSAGEASAEEGEAEAAAVSDGGEDAAAPMTAVEAEEQELVASDGIEGMQEVESQEAEEAAEDAAEEAAGEAAEEAAEEEKGQAAEGEEAAEEAAEHSEHKGGLSAIFGRRRLAQSA
eukprot:CAMPEP_0118926484 /NCGR_PEP_ID=MMETSP1169-20130426/4158_1 /TAXON_ID=36882 /ORGANISM="Pyramimonas obovata, Strain CCMP722" /LENGTH=344 /DNA_ID=CAMNT_0006868039 /DNA_START=126 /DNA_END=1160 /DNA_ORIENTATION=-